MAGPRPGCQWRQTFTDAAGKVHWDHIYATELFSNYTLRPLHDYVMAQEHVAVAKIRRHLQQVPPRYVVALKTDCLVLQDLPKKFLPAVRELTARKHPDGTPVYRFEECLEGQYREPRIEAPYLDWPPGWQRVEDPLLHCLNGKSLLLSGMPGTGKTHLARQIVAQLCELGEVVKLVSKTHCSVQNLGAGAQTADRFVRRSIRNGSCELDRLVIEEITQLDSSFWADIAELSLNPKVKFLLLGDFRQLPAPDTCLVISHANRMRLNEQHNLRLAPEGAVTLRYEGGAGAAGTNSPQTMRVWPGLRLVGTGGKQGLLRHCVRSEPGEREARNGGALHARRAIAPHAAVPRHHLRQLPGPHPAGPGAPVRHHEPALRAAPPVRGRLAGRAAVRALARSNGEKGSGGPRGTGRGCAFSG